MNQKLLVRVLLIVLAVVLVAGIVIGFTPALNSLRGDTASDGSSTAFTVNGAPVSTNTLAAIQRSNPVYSLVQTGPLADDFKTFIVETAVQQSLIAQSSKDISVSRSEVNTQVQQVRDQNNLKSNKDYLAALAQNNLTDASFRQAIHDQLAVNGKVKQLNAQAPKPTGAQLQAYYQLHQSDYMSDPQVRARLISVSDQKKAGDLLAQLKSGADFATLASANSLDYKDRGGAVAAVTGGQVTPVSEAALQPAEVATAAFALTQGGLSPVIKSGSKFYIVKVEQFLQPAVKPFSAVKTDVTGKVTTLIQQQGQQDWVDGLAKTVKVDDKDPSWAYHNPPVATVAGHNILFSDLIGAVLQNQQLSQLLQQAPDQASQFVSSFFMPQVLTQQIQSYAAAEVVKRDKLPLVGPRGQLLQDLASYGTRDIKVTDAEIQAYYDKNKSKYETPASADVDVITFPDKASAEAFRQNFPAQDSAVIQSAAQTGGALTEHGSVKQGDQNAQTQQPTLDPALDKAIFSAGRLQSAGAGSLSAVVKTGGSYALAWVHELVPATVTPLASVRTQVEQAALTEKQDSAKAAYIAKVTKDVSSKNMLSSVLAAQQTRLATAATSAASGNSTAAGSGASSGGVSATGSSGASQ